MKKNNAMYFKVLSVNTKSGVSKTSGNDYIKHDMYLMLDDGSIGVMSIFGTEFVPIAGDIVEIGFSVSSRHEIMPRVTALHTEEALKQA